MADYKKRNENDNVMIWSELVSNTIFGRDSDKNEGRRLAVGLFNEGIYVQISRQDPDDTKSRAFKKKINFVTTKNFVEIGLANIARELMKRIKKMENGEEIKWNPLTIYSSDNVMTATSKVDFDASTFTPKGETKGRPLVSVVISKRKDKDTEWKDAEKDKFIFGNASTIHRKDKDDKDVVDTNLWSFLQMLELNMLACVDKSSTSRSLHMAKFMEAKFGSEDSDKKGSENNSYKKKSYKDDDDDEDSMPF